MIPPNLLTVLNFVGLKKLTPNMNYYVSLVESGVVFWGSHTSLPTEPLK
jgi:hypothetical protein